MPAALSGRSCLVLGAGGFIGFNLCRALTRAGARVRGFGRRPTYAAPPATEAWVDAEFGDHAALARALEGMEVAFHLLGGSVPAAAERDPAGDLRTHAAAFLDLLSLCQAAGTRHFIFVSSGGTVYGPARILPIPEDHATDPISVYGIHKLLMEKHLGLRMRRDGMRVTILRAGNPYGPYQRPGRGQGLVANLMLQRLSGRTVEIWGDGSTVRDYLHVDDLTAALLLAVTYEGPYHLMNLGSGIGRSVTEVVEAVDDVLGLGGAGVTYRHARPADVPVNVLDISRIRAELGWQAEIGWAEGLLGTADWFRSTYGRKAVAGDTT